MNLDAEINNEIFRKDYKPVIAKNRHLASLAATRLKGVGTDYQAGTVLAKNTVDGLFYAYNNAGSSGLDTASCVLMETIADNGESTLMGRGIFSGELFKDNLVGYDAAAKTDLGAREYTASDSINIVKF
jgi:hypothetical protein